MNELQTFENPNFGQVRTVLIGGEPWFVGRDIAGALGYKDVVQAVRMHVDDEDKGGVEMTTPGGMQRVVCINESGLYSLILSSKLPAAKEFKRWITSEVLPMIRKTGVYRLCADDADSAIPMRTLTPDDYLAAAKIIATCKNDRLRIVLQLLAKGGWDVGETQKLVTTPVSTADIAERLNKAKEDHKLTWKQLGETVHIDPNVLRMYGEGRRFPRASRYEAIVKALDTL